jgi:ATP synthase F1 complex assembly factor 1
LLILSGKANPFFIFPVRKSTGHFNLVVQAQDKSFIYTFLEDYKRNPDYATPYLVITIFDELVFKKGISLVRGDIIGDLSKNDAEVVFNMTRHYFTNQSNYRKVITFNRESSKFAYQEHIDECLRFYL